MYTLTIYFTKINLKHSETTLHLIGKVHFTTYIFYKNQPKTTERNKEKTLYTLQKSTSETTLHSKIGKSTLYNSYTLNIIF